jgi:hypothetical protein
VLDKGLEINKVQNSSDWRLWIFGISLVFILITGIIPHVNNDFLRWNLLPHFDLAQEMKFAPWWSGSLLLLCGVLAYQLSTRDSDLQYSWLILASIFSLLSFDEIGSIHERATHTKGGFITLIIAGLLGSMAYIYACWILWKRKRNKYGVILLLAGLAVFGLVVPAEYLEHSLDWPYYLEGPRAAFEEGLELSGMLICLIGIIKFQSHSKSEGSVLELTLNPEKLPRLTTIITIAFAFHIGVSWFVVRFVTVGYRGNPAVWYFMAVFFVLALSYFRKAIIERSSVYYIYILFSIYFMLLSVGSLYFILPRPDSELHNLWLFASPIVFLGTQLIFLILLRFLLKRRITKMMIVKFFLIAIVLLLGWFIDDQFVNYVVSGFFALTVALLFLPKPNDVNVNKIIQET